MAAAHEPGNERAGGPDARSRRLRRWAAPVVAGVGLAALAWLMVRLFEPELRTDVAPCGAPNARLPVAVLGDSDSHSYRDALDDKRRGGAFHDVTWNWLEIWQLRRSAEIDPGRFGVWGTGYRAARLRRWLGLAARAPAKLDFEHNYAVSGLRCGSLLQSWPYQARWLVDHIQADPARWREGLVIIRIGVNDLGQIPHLERWGRTGLDADARAVVEQCASAIREATEAIRAVSSARIVLVGVANDVMVSTRTFELWPALSDVERASAVLDHFDAQLRRIADADPRMLFVDDTTPFRERFGDRRTADLRSAFPFGELLMLRGDGDAPQHVLLADRHYGTVMSAWWLNHLIRSLNDKFQLGLTPLADEEIFALVRTGGPARDLSACPDAPAPGPAAW